MTDYSAKEFNATQIPTALTFTGGKAINKPSTNVMAEYATHAAVIAVTGLNSGIAQVATATDSGAIYVSALGATTFKKVGTNTETIVATSGAIGLDNDVVFFATTGASTSTLAAGHAGQVIVLTMSVDGGDMVLTPASFLNGTTITFDDAGDSATLVSNGTSWYTVGTVTATVA